jgi:hypothetical protein
MPMEPLLLMGAAPQTIIKVRVGVIMCVCVCARVCPTCRSRNSVRALPLRRSRRSSRCVWVCVTLCEVTVIVKVCTLTLNTVQHIQWIGSLTSSKIRAHQDLSNELYMRTNGQQKVNGQHGQSKIRLWNN